jgi:uncharacterized membrane protein YkvA (DUF1232 family)
MNTQSTNSRATTPRNVNSIMRDLQRIWQLLRDPAIPGWKWLLPLGAFLYWIWPIDLIPGLPFDDIAVVIFAMSMLLQMAARTSPANPSATSGTAGTTQDSNDTTIDTTWRVVDK